MNETQYHTVHAGQIPVSRTIATLRSSATRQDPLSQVRSVWLHGAGLAGNTWHHMTHRYALATTPDIPGHGAADRIYPPRVETYADALERDVPKDAVLIGHSLGGMVALEIAARLGRRISGLIVIEAVPTVRDRLSGRITARVAQSIYSAIPPKWLARVSGAGQADRTRAELRRQMEATDRARVAAALEASGQYDGRARLAGIEVPTLVIVGTVNQATHRGAKVIAKGIPGAEFVALRGGHMLHTDNPEAVLSTVNAFLGARIPNER